MAIFDHFLVSHLKPNSIISCMKLTFVTGNKNKVAEVQAILGPHVELLNQSVEVPELQGKTAEIAIAKCRAAAQQISGPVITEDTSLGFTALNGLPGPYIKHFMDSIGHDGLNKMLIGFNDSRATALCTFAFLSSPSSNPILFEGTCDGRIVHPRGPTTFGWDAIFQPDGHTETFAQMDKTQKNSISHRSRALEKLKTHLSTSQPE